LWLEFVRGDADRVDRGRRRRIMVRAGPQISSPDQIRCPRATWIEEYNHDRRHSALGTSWPTDYELSLGHGATPERTQQAA
jgi:hypothetical protein